jgi:hypothetical protein
MNGTFRSLMSKKRIVFGNRFKDGRTRVFIENAHLRREPLYVIGELSSETIFQLSDSAIKIYNYPEKDIVVVNKWPKEIFRKVN